MTDKRIALMRRYSPISRTQLKRVAADYASALPDWILAHDGTALVRRFGPLEQMIWFQKMSFAAYRPTHGMSSLVLPEAHLRMLFQVLDVKHREVEYRSHERRLTETLVAMEDQFQPRIREPLDVANVLRLCEMEAQSAKDTTNNMAMLAILSAWLGADGQALVYCSRMQETPLPPRAPMPEWEERMRRFSRDLSNTIKAGTSREFLEASMGGRSD
jgi:hypothetical protein